MEGIMQQLRTDAELLSLRKEWKESGIEVPFPLFHFESYLGLDDYKQRLRKQLDSYMEQKS